MTTTTPKRRGRKKGDGMVITADKQREILAVLATGGSRNDAADYVGVGRSTLSDHIARDESFAEQVKKAESAGKIKHLQKIEKSGAWQASAWFLERKYPAEYRQRTEHTGADGAPLAPPAIKIVFEGPE